MKILFVITRGDTIGGAQVHVLTLANLLKKNGHDVLVSYGGDREGPFSELLIANNINHISIRGMKREISLFNDLLSILRLRSIINNYKPDIVTLHSSKAGFIGWISLLFSKIPVLFTVHGWAFTEGIDSKKAKFKSKIEGFLGYLTSKIIVVS